MTSVFDTPQAHSGADSAEPLSLSTAAAHTLATTTKTPPHVQSRSPRWLLRMLPWVESWAGTYRVNRRFTYEPDEQHRPRAHNKYGETELDLAAGHNGEPELPQTFVDYDAQPREYELSVAQTILRMHTRVADLYNQPMNQLEHQLRLTVEELREHQEQEMLTNPEFGLLANVHPLQRLRVGGGTSGPPTPADLDRLLARRRSSHLFLAHPKTIAAFGRACSRQGIYPQPLELHGSAVQAWRGVPLLPCDKIPISTAGTSPILVMRTGEHNGGVVGLHQTGIPEEHAPSLNVRFMGINEKGIGSYLVSAYFSAAVLTPDALGMLDGVEIFDRESPEPITANPPSSPQETAP